jgi:hypothetical protein
MAKIGNEIELLTQLVVNAKEGLNSLYEVL